MTLISVASVTIPQRLGLPRVRQYQNAPRYVLQRKISEADQMIRFNQIHINSPVLAIYLGYVVHPRLPEHGDSVTLFRDLFKGDSIATVSPTLRADFH